MDLIALRRVQRAKIAERVSITRGSSHRTCHHFSKESVVWLTSHGSDYTASEAAEYLGHITDSVRTKARALGVTFKQHR